MIAGTERSSKALIVLQAPHILTVSAQTLAARPNQAP